jgi:two-component system, NarL family, nitrate/nitrite response regulator NarL
VSTGAGRDRPIRIVIADDHRVFREALQLLLEAERDFRVVGSAGDGDEAVALVRELHPDILLLDIAMPRMGGIEALRQMADGGTPTKVILLTGAIDKADVVTAVQLGARGLILKESGAAVLLKGIRGVLAGQYWIGREAVSGLLEVLRSLVSTGGELPRKDFGLTAREIDIVGAVVAAYGNKEIGERFHISEKTVKHHLTNIFDKLGVSNRLELALLAVHHQIVPRDPQT